MKYFLILTMFLTGCSFTEYYKFDKSQYTATCVKSEVRQVERCVSKIDLFISQVNAGVSPAIIAGVAAGTAARARRNRCTNKLVNESVCLEYNVKLKE